MSLTLEEAQRLADEYQRKVLAHLLSILPITGGIPSTSSTTSNPNTNNEEEPPRSRLN